VNFDRGTQMAGIIKDESRHDPSRGFAGGYEMETLPGFGLAGVATNTIPGAWGAEYAKVIEMYDHFAGMCLVGEDLPQSTNGVTLHSTEKDQHGMPVPVVHFKDHPNDIAMRNHAYKAGTAVYRSLGASQVFELPPFPNTHNMGSCRQSEKPRDGVCNKGPADVLAEEFQPAEDVDVAPNGGEVEAVGGSSPIGLSGRQVFQEIDQLAIMKPCTKWADRIHSLKRIPEQVNVAFQKAMSGKPGPVYLDCAWLARSAISSRLLDRA
jgi:hypothetical protein